MESLPKKIVGPDDVFTMGNEPVPVELQFDVTDFWSWSLSDLCLNVIRGNFGEFLVAKALGLTEKPRKEWENFDLKTKEGIKIEVKTTGFVQSWPQRDVTNTSIQWEGIGKTEDSHGKVEGKHRWADVYVFCLQDQKDRDSYNALDLSKWKFWVISASILNERIPCQQSIRRRPLENLGAEKVGWLGLREAILRASNS